ncbi:MAG: FAD binding domain-containing protein [Gammaproteobacteria bacterium]
MRPAPIELIQPNSISDAVTAIAAGGVPIAGGQSLLQSMRLRSTSPAVLVDISSPDFLSDRIEIDHDSINVGCKVTHAQFAADPAICSKLPWLADAASAIGDVQVRNFGTIVGNVCWADPRANMAVALLATGATVEICSDADPTKTESIAIDDFFAGFRRTRASGRLVKAIQINALQPATGIYKEFSRQPQDLALVNVGVVKSGGAWRIAVGGIANIPVRLESVEASVDSEAFESALSDFFRHASELEPPADSFGDRAYKFHLAEVMIADLIREVKMRIGAEMP